MGDVVSMGMAVDPIVKRQILMALEDSGGLSATAMSQVMLKETPNYFVNAVLPELVMEGFVEQAGSRWQSKFIITAHGREWLAERGRGK